MVILLNYSWKEKVEEYDIDSSFGKFIQKALTIVKFLGLK